MDFLKSAEKQARFSIAEFVSATCVWNGSLQIVLTHIFYILDSSTSNTNLRPSLSEDPITNDPLPLHQSYGFCCFWKRISISMILNGSLQVIAHSSNISCNLSNM